MFIKSSFIRLGSCIHLNVHESVNIVHNMATLPTVFQFRVLYRMRGTFGEHLIWRFDEQ